MTVSDVPPRIIDPEADRHFREIASANGLDPDNPWVGSYVEYEWGHARHAFQRSDRPLRADADVLEFGANIGGTSIVLGLLGARVVGVEVDAGYVDVAKANAGRYDLGNRVRFLHVADTTVLPFDDRQFDVICCNSVLEYVDHNQLDAVMRELDRVLKPGGVLHILGTSSRLWPREIHSGRWFINYLPRGLDPVFFRGEDIMRGVNPLRLLRGFKGYDNLDRGGRIYLDIKSKMGVDGFKRTLLAMAHQVLAPLGLSSGLISPNISVSLQKSGV